ncbi:hypothetical protein PG999_002988 [Apiospora kogelbergensis]|uniref:Major Facilitator Superfamily protein n=1 Tax=Apiospora kogelbergensis TaxID=1337665 RepID=A0AAW0RA32_9PEZI
MKATACFLGGIRRFFVVVGADTLWQSHRDVKLLIVLRMVRLLGHGGTTLILAIYLHGLGFRDSDVGLFMTLTLIGDLIISSVLVYVGDAVGVRLTAIAGSILMCVAGVAFAYVSNFWLLLLAAILGDHSANEIDPFKPIEESAISRLSTAETCSDLFAWWSMLGMLGTAVSNLLTGLLIGHLQSSGFCVLDSHRIVFISYAGIGFARLLGLLVLSSNVELDRYEGSIIGSTESGIDSDDDRCRKSAVPPATSEQAHVGDLETAEHLRNMPRQCGSESPGQASLRDTPGIEPPSQTCRLHFFVLRFHGALVPCSFFDFVGSGLAQVSWMTYFFQREYHMPEASLGTATFVAGLVSSVLNLASSPLARAVGQVQTMVACHTVNSASLLLVSVPGDGRVALALFIFRILTREMDNAPRQAFISRGVGVGERTAAMAVVNVVKTVGSCVGLYATGWFAALDSFWLAFIVAGVLKLVYNVLISAFFWGS